MLYDTKNPHGGDIYAGNVRLDFSANTNPFGTPESVLAAVTRALPEVHRYPDPYCRALRAAIAAAEGVPAYVVFSNATLADMAAKAPRTMEDFLEVSGVGEIKAARYGEAFLKAIAAYEEADEA